MPRGPTDQTPPPGDAGVDEQRNQLIDVARVLAMVLVVLFHSLLFRIELTRAGPVAHPWEPGPAWWPWSWLAMSLPLFFVAGGYVSAIAVDHQQPGRAGYARYLVHRSHRLVGPLVLFVTVVAAAATWAAWHQGPAPATPYPGQARPTWLEAASAISRDYCFFLWFVAVWLVLVAVAPFMVRANDRWGPLLLLVVGGAAAALDRWSFLAADPSIRQPNLLLVWGACLQLGIAYHRGWLRRGPAWVPWTVLAGGLAGLGLMLAVLGYPPSALAFSDPSVANNLPPTAALIVLGLVQVAALALIERTGPLRLPAAVQRRVTRLNALTVDVYLWQNTCVLIAMQLLVWVALALPGRPDALVAPAVVSATTLLVVTLLVPQVARLGQLLTPREGTSARFLPALAGVGLLVLGTALAWTYGVVLHPDRPWSSLGVAAVWLGAALVALAVRGTGPYGRAARPERSRTRRAAPARSDP